MKFIDCVYRCDCWSWVPYLTTDAGSEKDCFFCGRIYVITDDGHLELVSGPTKQLADALRGL